MLVDLLQAGVGALQEYIATHVLTCLVPAFMLAGALVSFVNREAVLEFLGEQANRFRAFSFAGIASFLVAACSCTVIPVASGLYYSGAAVGAAFIVLWVAPAANVLALLYTGNILGAPMVIARIVGALSMAYAVGFVMSLAFRNETPAPAPRDTAVEGRTLVAGRHLYLLVLILGALLLPNYLVTEGPYVHKVVVWAAATGIVVVYAWRRLSSQEIAAWARETWWFVRAIFPLLLIGVFIVGIVGAVLPEEWIRRWLGGNSLRASFLATLIGGVTYFATMTEAPFVDTLMQLGMGKGPALALLLTGPGISLPNWLAVARVFGFKKALVYVPTIMVLGTLVGFIYGSI